MGNHYIRRFDLSKYSLKSFDDSNEICCDKNNSDLLTYDANGTQKVVADTTTVQTLQGKTLSSADGIVKVLPVTGAKAFTSGSALSVFTTTSATLLGASGIVFWSIFATDGTDVQIDTFHTTYSTVNKAGTSTAVHTYVSAEEAKALSGGTLTTTATATDGGSGVVTFKITPTTSLTPTTAQISYTIFPLIGAVTLL